MREVVFTEDGVLADRVGSQSRPASFPRGRVCAEPGCGTRLSVYNADRFCALHGSFPSVADSRPHRRRKTAPSPRRAPTPGPGRAPDRRRGDERRIARGEEPPDRLREADRRRGDERRIA